MTPFLRPSIKMMAITTTISMEMTFMAGEETTSMVEEDKAMTPSDSPRSKLWNMEAAAKVTKTIDLISK